MIATENILTQSPLDFVEEVSIDPSDSLLIPTSGVTKKWLASRFNIRAMTEDGSMVLWNTFSSSMNIFKPDQLETVKPLLSRKGFEGAKEGIIAYLAKRGYLVEEGTDEYRRVHTTFTAKHNRTDNLEFILLASEDCNFRCQYCYEKFARGTMKPEVREGIKNMLKARLPSLTRLHVDWFGGEPLYGMAAVDELGEFFHETALENNLQYYASMTTNGYLLTEEVADKLLKWRIKSFQITVDGPPENHNCNRPTREGGPTFDIIMNNLRAMARREENFHINIRINYDRNNYPMMSAFLAQLEQDFGGDSRFYVAFHAVGRWGGENDAKLEVCGQKESGEALRAMVAEARRRNLKMTSLRQVNRVGSGVCYAARPYNFLIGATGKIMKCTIALDTMESNIVGQLNRDGTYTLNQDHFALWTELAYDRDTQCQSCSVLPLCQGVHCPLIRINRDTQPCMDLRTKSKSSLLQAFELEGDKVRISQIDKETVPFVVSSAISV